MINKSKWTFCPTPSFHMNDVRRYPIYRASRIDVSKWFLWIHSTKETMISCSCLPSNRIFNISRSSCSRCFYHMIFPSWDINHSFRSDTQLKIYPYMEIYICNKWNKVEGVQMSFLKRLLTAAISTRLSGHLCYFWNGNEDNSKPFIK